jgi:DNA polymerase-3 subunit epsilon
MNNIKILWLDTETTGLDSSKNNIWEIGLIAEINGKIVDQERFKFCPPDGTIYDDSAMKTSHITKEEIEKFHPEKDVFPFILNIVKKHLTAFSKFDKWFVAGYRTHFDLDFLYKLFERNKQVLAFYIFGNYIDVSVLATQALMVQRDQMKDFKLGTVANFLGIKVDENEELHDALTDIKLTRDIYYHLLKKEHSIDSAKMDILTKTVVLTQAPTTKKFIKNLSDKFNFGKFKDLSIAEIIKKEPGYIIWVSENVSKVEIDHLILSQAKEEFEIWVKTHDKNYHSPSINDYQNKEKSNKNIDDQINSQDEYLDTDYPF